MVRTYGSKKMIRRWPVALFYNMIDISAVNAIVIWQQLQCKDESRYNKRKRKRILISLGKELGRLFTLLSATRKVTSQQNKGKRSAAQDQSPKEKKNKNQKCRQICATCKLNICQEHSQIICDGCNYKS